LRRSGSPPHSPHAARIPSPHVSRQCLQLRQSTEGSRHGPQPMGPTLPPPIATQRTTQHQTTILPHKSQVRAGQERPDRATGAALRPDQRSSARSSPHRAARRGLEGRRISFSPARRRPSCGLPVTARPVSPNSSQPARTARACAGALAALDSRTRQPHLTAALGQPHLTATPAASLLRASTSRLTRPPSPKALPTASCSSQPAAHHHHSCPPPLQLLSTASSSVPSHRVLSHRDLRLGAACVSSLGALHTVG